MVKARVYIYQKQFDGFPKEGDLKIEEQDLPALKNGEFLAEAVYLSVDPYMRSMAVRLPIGAPFFGWQVAKITESKNPKFEVGKYVVSNFGCRSHTVSDGNGVRVLPNLQDLPVSLGVGILGMPGNTAYFGFLEICQPKSGETVAVSGAAGAVGSVVGQIAKIKGCTVIGIAGSDDKGKWLTNELGFDHFINYKTQNVEEELKRVAPQGIDCYFDNVGGEISSSVLNQMNDSGRISVAGSIAGYNVSNLKASIVQRAMVTKQLKMQGFHVASFQQRFPEGITQLLNWIKEGKLKYKETVTNGFENMFTAFVDMLKGGNIGKAVVKV